MTSQRPSQFDDPALKAALKRAVGGEAAPAGLRQRVQGVLAAEAARPGQERGAEPAQASAPAPIPLRPARGWKSNPLMGLAAAALLIIGIGLMFNHYWEPAGSFDDGLPVAMAADMVAAHNRALREPAIHDLDVAKTDMDQIRTALKQRLEHPVLVASIADDWQFQGARITTVGDTPASQLVFRKGDDSVSIFSVSGDAYYATQEGMEYKQTQDGHAIAGFVKSGIVHCVVGSKGSKLREKDLARLRDAIRDHVSAPPADSSTSSRREDCRSSGLLAAL